jgi:ATP-dependent DNA ligase
MDEFPVDEVLRTTPVFYAFDPLRLDGKDLRQMPLIKRKKQLARLVQAAVPKVALRAAHRAAREGFFAEICARDLGGIVAKRNLGIYKDDGNTWLKVKNRTYSQAEGRHELLTRGRQVQGRRFEGTKDTFRLTYATVCAWLAKSKR